MTDISELDQRVRSLETQQAVIMSTTDRAEKDLADIASSVSEIKDVVTKWKGGIGALFIAGSILMTFIAAVVEFLFSLVRGK